LFKKVLEPRSRLRYEPVVNNVHSRTDAVIKALLTLTRGRLAEAGEALADRNALVILDRQIRDAAHAFERAKRTLAVAIAQDRQESARLAETKARIADLEQRVVAALDAGDDALARDGAAAIAGLETDATAATQAQALFAAEILRLRRHVATAQARIAELDRGRRLARAAEAVRELRRGRTEAAHPPEATLAEAEATLRRLRQRQAEAEAAEQALDELDGAASASITESLAAKGYGPRLSPNADAVLERLRPRLALTA
jgi:phage shock protein A